MIFSAIKSRPVSIALVKDVSTRVDKRQISNYDNLSLLILYNFSVTLVFVCTYFWNESEHLSSTLTKELQFFSHLVEAKPIK